MGGMRAGLAAVAACVLGGPAAAAEPVVVLEARWVTVSPGVADQHLPADRVKLMTDANVRAFFDAVQQDRTGGVLSAPKVTVANDQEAVVRVGDVRTFVTAVTATTKDGAAVLVPQTTPVETGITLTARPTVSADGRSVRVAVRGTRVTAEPGKLVPVTTMITPVFEGGAQGVPVPFTQHLEVPTVTTREVARAVSIPVGGTAAVGGWKEPAPPTPSKLPYLNRLFRNVSSVPAENDVVLLVTVREVLAAPAGADAAEGQVEPAGLRAADAATNPKVAELVAAYRRACAVGDRKAARVLAVEALALDPTCFGGRAGE